MLPLVLPVLPVVLLFVVLVVLLVVLPPPVLETAPFARSVSVLPSRSVSVSPPPSEPSSVRGSQNKQDPLRTLDRTVEVMSLAVRFLRRRAGARPRCSSRQTMASSSPPASPPPRTRTASRTSSRPEFDPINAPTTAGTRSTKSRETRFQSSPACADQKVWRAGGWSRRSEAPLHRDQPLRRPGASFDRWVRYEYRPPPWTIARGSRKEVLPRQRPARSRPAAPLRDGVRTNWLLTRSSWCSSCSCRPPLPRWCCCPRRFRFRISRRLASSNSFVSLVSCHLSRSHPLESKKPYSRSTKEAVCSTPPTTKPS
mmetsp:Transcript_2680/g.5804  ORF Transcript_2680/g.5804 Transcript_2680/m.5804 type:complete len:312 (-) Transcript_2680:627-1562(-)